MATNLVSLIMQFLTPDIVARIAATLDPGRLTSPTAAAMPPRASRRPASGAIV